MKLLGPQLSLRAHAVGSTARAVFVLGAVVVAALAGVLPVAPATAGAPSAGMTWHYEADVDGVNGEDAVTITAQPGFTVNDLGQGQGQIKVHVDLAGGGFAEVWVDSLGYSSVRSPWTPWLGATDLDRRPGQEIVIGTSTGAHAQLFAAYAYREGQLVQLSSPLGEDWLVNSSYGTGSSGWRCTRHGVEVRAVSAVVRGRVRLTTAKYELQPSGWVRTSHHRREVHVDAHGRPPAGTSRYPTFGCPGLPKRVL